MLPHTREAGSKTEEGQWPSRDSTEADTTMTGSSHASFGAKTLLMEETANKMPTGARGTLQSMQRWGSTAAVWRVGARKWAERRWGSGRGPGHRGSVSGGGLQWGRGAVGEGQGKALAGRNRRNCRVGRNRLKGGRSCTSGHCACSGEFGSCVDRAVLTLQAR